MPKLSVLMACKNLNQQCLKSIQSILVQDVDLELIITVDGGENTLKIDDNRVKIDIFNTNKGMSAATNNCYKLSAGEYITVHDDDDWSEPNRFAECFKIIGDQRAITSNINIIEGHISTKKVFHTDNFYSTIRLKPPAHHCATTIRRDLWEEIGPYNEAYICSDSIRMIKLGIYMILHKEPFPVIDQQLYNYIVRPSSLSKDKKWRSQVEQSRKPIYNAYHNIMKMTPEQFLIWYKDNQL